MTRLATVLAMLLLPRIAGAITCGSVDFDVFELADRARQIAILDVKGPAITVARVLAGDSAAWQKLPASPRSGVVKRNGKKILVLQPVSCEHLELKDRLPAGHLLAFATADGWAVNPYGDSFVALAAGGEEPLVAAVQQWLAHPDAPARLRQLLPLASGIGPLADAARTHLSVDPALLGKLSAAERASLLLAANVRLTSSPRLRLVESLELLVKRLKNAQQGLEPRTKAHFAEVIRKGPTDAERQVALNLCEQLRGARIPIDPSLSSEISMAPYGSALLDAEGGPALASAASGCAAP